MGFQGGMKLIGDGDKLGAFGGDGARTKIFDVIFGGHSPLRSLPNIVGVANTGNRVGLGAVERDYWSCLEGPTSRKRREKWGTRAPRIRRSARNGASGCGNGYSWRAKY